MATYLRPHRHDIAGALIVATAIISLTTPPLAAQQVTERDYARAEQFLPWHAAKLVSGDEVTPEFFDGDRFWFRSRTESGHEFVVVDPAAPSRALAFDHARLAAALSLAADTAYEGNKLPFTTFEFADGGRSIQFHLADTVALELRYHRLHLHRPHRRPRTLHCGSSLPRRPLDRLHP